MVTQAKSGQWDACATLLQNSLSEDVEAVLGIASKYTFARGKTINVRCIK
jgi:hypothetical protein